MDDCASGGSSNTIMQIRPPVKTARLTILLLPVVSGLSMRHAVAQGSLHVPVSAQCVELNETVLTLTANGHSDKAELALSAALAGGAEHVEDLCAGLVLSNLASLTAVSGRLAEGEMYVERSLSILEKIYPPEDPVLLRPLQILAAVRYEQGKTARAKEAFRKMQAVRCVRPEDRALVHAMAGALLDAEHRFSEAESAYLAAIRSWEEAGRGESADTGAIFTALGSLYIKEERFDEARQALDHASKIFTYAKDEVAMDHIKLLAVRGVLHTRLGEWREGEQDLKNAVSMAGCESRSVPVACASLLTNYAYVLRKNHHRQEARSIEARAALLHNDRAPDSVVDVTELMAKPKPKKK